MAFGLMLILEGLMPFAAPAMWREAFRRAIEMRDGQLRFIGAISMLAGLMFMLFAK
ncbi:DUF2065 domain-containing protein [Betaproteobacteria bacterium SCN2]|nr:DUF2065 domain-containing protein [Betaproteobacteria bacterium SCN2]